MSEQLYEVAWTKQNRLRNLISSLGRLHNEDVRIGFFEESGMHPESTHLNYPTLAAIHEVRTDGEQRPILGISSQLNMRTIQKYSADQIGSYINRAAVLKREAVGGYLRKIGNKGVALTKPIFGDSALLKSNSANTIRAKGADRPMIEYGALRGALASKISTSGKVS